jgi:hypothetical protein
MAKLFTQPDRTVDEILTLTTQEHSCDKRTVSPSGKR